MIKEIKSQEELYKSLDLDEVWNIQGAASESAYKEFFIALKQFSDVDKFAITSDDKFYVCRDSLIEKFNDRNSSKITLINDYRINKKLYKTHYKIRHDVVYNSIGETNE